MNRQLSNIEQLIQQSALTEAEKQALLKEISNADKQFNILEFKLDRTEQVKKTTGVLLEETIEELEQKRTAVEEKNRDLEIESALERVRTVAMAMRRSDEVINVCHVMYDELLALGFLNIRNAQISIKASNTQSYLISSYSDTEAVAMKEVSYTASPVVKDLYSELERSKDAFYQREFTGKQFEAWRAWRETVSSVPDTRTRTATSLCFYLFSIGIGHLGVSTYDAITSDQVELLKRFKNVFELCYKRYEDVSKAEAQAREAQIQLGLERVRARAMAMHKTDELLDACELLYKELTVLGIQSNSVCYVLVNEGDKTGLYYGINPVDGKVSEKPFIYPHTETEVMRTILESWKKQETFHVAELDEPATLAHHTWIGNAMLASLKKHDPNTSFTVEAFLAASPQKIALYSFNFAQGYLFILRHDRLSNEQEAIAIRFTRVFEMTYRRFLDLQKAEAQARESQIQLALERVRAKAMAMQTSEELNELIGTVFGELTKLDFVLTRCLIMIFDPETKASRWWMANPEAPAQPMNYLVKNHKKPAYDAYLKAWGERNLNWNYILNGKVKRDWDDFLFVDTELAQLPRPVIEGMKAPEQVVLSASFNNFGCLTLASLEPLSDEHCDIMLRFAKVFDMCYTRFSDLKQAEAQVRESQIQLALERVRARTMAMQHSLELSETASEMFKQIQALGMHPWACGFNIFDKDEKAVTQWMSLADGGISPPFRTPLTEDPFFINIYEGRQQKKDLLVMESSGKDLEETYRYMFSLPDSKKVFGDIENNGFEMPKFQITHCAYFSQGYLVFITYEQAAGSHDIFKRFARIFEQTYTRFLDLKRAEAQAREAQIENALEKVRSRSLVMHKSDELDQVVAVVAEKLRELGIKMEGAVICTHANEGQGMMMWSAMAAHMNAPPLYVPYGHPLIDEWGGAWKNGADYIGRSWTYEEKVGFWEWAFEHSDFKYLPEFRKQQIRQGTGYALSASFEKNSGIAIPSHTGEILSKSHAEILKRFSKVFEQAYIRFLDLKKAEAQAREGQIQLALERVRARTMAMQKSDELHEVIQLVFDQLLQLDFNIDVANFALNYKATDDFDLLLAVGHGNYPMKIHVPYLKHPVFDRFNKAKKKGGLLVDALSKDEKDSFFKHFFKYIPDAPDETKAAIFARPGFVRSSALMKNTALTIHNYEGIPYSGAENDTLLRFGQVFDQTYTRFNDLKQAEEQAREAQIQLALERVRARTMAMQHSDELAETATEMFQQLHSLEITPERVFIAIPRGQERIVDFWGTDQGGSQMSTRFEANIDGAYSFKTAFKGWEDNKPEVEVVLKGKQLEEHISYIANVLNLPFRRELVKGQRILYGANFSKGMLVVMTPEPQTKETHSILKRFAGVFDQTYTRFLDLQKAEEQARQGQIQLGLERVRAAAMAMHNSQDVGNATALVFSELYKLGIITSRCGVCIVDGATQQMEVWSATSSLDGKVNRGAGKIDMNGHPLWLYLLHAWTQKIASFSYELKGKELTDYYTAIKNAPNYEAPQDILVGTPLDDNQYCNCYIFNEGCLFTFTNAPFSPENSQVLEKFAAVFGLTYRRYLDLTKAEAQAREGQIEAALERVRSRAMAMRSSADLNATANTVFVELRKLGVDLVRCGVGLMERQSHISTIHAATNSTESGNLEVLGTLDMTAHPTLAGIYKHWRQDEDFYPVLEGKSLKDYYKALRENNLPVPEWKSGQKQYGYFFQFPDGCLYAWSGKQESEETIKTLKRFTAVIGLTYTRYMELQNAELNAKEAIKQASLDRVRAEIASMRKRSDLERITPLIWDELTILGITFIRCGVFIMDEEQRLIHTFLSTPDGKAIGAFHVPFDTSGNFEIMVDKWRHKEPYIDHWKEEAFSQFADTLVKQGAITSKAQYMRTMPHEGVHLNFLPFLQGMLYVGNIAPLSDDNINLIQAVAEAFSTAYARYEDFNKLEAAKQQVDNTLTQLKTTQNKLIQSEKMASLGELTAGIAHEIQNPLNFVNNFSEVSAELIDEMDEGLDKGDLEEVKAIAADIKENLKKIRHHGGRADGIVKGMLQHSRASSDQKEPTDMNKLADEYLRLAYHGLRAKNKEFNAELVTHFDESLPRPEVVPQDIGRVLINLYNNAFYATQQRAKASNGAYKPEITVTTSAIDGQVTIRVKDNGVGIPDNIREKIMQPFFTTKPTGEGTGLGLSLSYDIVVKGHDGKIDVETKENEFTEFIITLPIN